MRSGIFAKALTLAVGFAAIAPAALADTIYDCTLKELRTNLGWVPTEVVVSHVPGADEALVSDVFILSVFGEPRLEEVKKDNDKKLMIEWKLSLEAANGVRASFRYVLNILKPSMIAKIYVYPVEYSNHFGSTGTCKVKTE